MSYERDIGLQRQSCSDTVRPTSHNLRRRTKQKLYVNDSHNVVAELYPIGSVWFQFYNTFMGWARVI